MKRLSVAKTFTEGIVCGPIFRVREMDLAVRRCEILPEQAEAELARFDEAVASVAAELETLAADNPIFMGHYAMVQDFTLRAAVEAKIKEQHEACEWATEEALAEFRQVFLAMEDSYMRERAADIEDIAQRLLLALKHVSADKFASLKEPSIIVARDLFPSDTARLPRELVLGFVTEAGGVTSHVAIMARSQGIPALVGCAGILEAVEEGKELLLDAAAGLVLIDPEAAEREQYLVRQAEAALEQERLLKSAAQPVISRDGRQLKVYANVGSLQDIRALRALAVDGVGLFRTEFLFMDADHFPTEEEQFAVYREAAELLGEGTCIIRTLDIGGDKTLTYFEFPQEDNPFLGYRAIRLCLDRPEIFKTQLRAILRASAYGQLRIMFPMLIALPELRAAKALVAEAMAELRAEGQAFDECIPIGMMIETPAAVLLADDFAREVDFFSIGTNDLTQYVLAVDRGNKAIEQLYDSFHPAVLKSIALVIAAAHRAGIECGMCGEFAGHEKATALLLGMGLDEFSMAAAATPKLKERLRQLSYAEARAELPVDLRIS